MAAFKSIPELVKVGRELVFKDFYPAQPAFSFKDHEGKTGTLYAIGCQEFIKIGITYDFSKRFKQIDYGVPFEVCTIALRTVPSAGLTYAEAWLHDRFKDCRVKGEWFATTAKEVKAAMALAIKRAVIYERYCRDWHIAEVEDRQRPERKAKLEAEYADFLRRNPQCA